MLPIVRASSVSTARTYSAFSMNGVWPNELRSGISSMPKPAPRGKPEDASCIRTSYLRSAGTSRLPVAGIELVRNVGAVELRGDLADVAVGEARIERREVLALRPEHHRDTGRDGGREADEQQDLLHGWRQQRVERQR